MFLFLYHEHIILFHNYGSATQEGDNYELIRSEKGGIKIFSDEQVEALVYVFNNLYPYRIIKRKENVTGQSGNVLEINGKRYATPYRIPRYAVKTLEEEKEEKKVEEDMTNVVENKIYYEVQKSDPYSVYTIKQKKIYSILEYAKYAFSKFLKENYEFKPEDTYADLTNKLKEFHENQENKLIEFQSECKEVDSYPSFDYTDMNFF